MKTKKGNVKQAVKKVKKAVEKDSYGFTRGSKSSQAVLILATGKAPIKAVRKKFPSLSYHKLFLDLKARGFKVEQKDGLCSITSPAKV